MTRYVNKILLAVMGLFKCRCDHMGEKTKMYLNVRSIFLTLDMFMVI
jgi:hypothetical protein